MISTMYYCGQRDDSGHYIWTNDGSSYPFTKSLKLFGYLDNPDRFCGRCEGDAVVTLLVEPPRTVVGFREYSIDKRPGSHSTFMATGHHSYEDMIDAAKKLFPDVWARFKFQVRMVQHPDPVRLLERTTDPPKKATAD